MSPSPTQAAASGEEKVSGQESPLEVLGVGSSADSSRGTQIDPRFYFVPLAEATVPPSGLIEHLKDKWWLMHPEKGLVFYDKRFKSPQCNSNEACTRAWAKKHPWAEVRFIPSVFRRVDPHDYVC